MKQQCHYSLSALIIAALLCGCGDGGPTIAEQHDEQIESIWMPGRASTDAIAFLEQGGIYENASTEEDIDRSYILPLMKQLSAEFGLQAQALLDEPNVAFAIVVDISELTADDGRRAAIVDAIQQADDEFAGLLIDKWGKHWLSFDLLDEHELETFPEDTLTRLKQHIADDRAANRG